VTTVGAVVRDERTAPFFDGTAAGQFLLRKCQQCQALLTPYAVQCGPCGSTDLTWEPAGGGAKVVSWVVPHTKPDANGHTDTTVLAIAELDEGPWWWSQVVDADPAAVAMGTRLRIDFQRANDESEYVPVFRLA
jgi:uncharacterized OB-fold protein